MFYIEAENATVLRSDRTHLTFPDIYSNPWLKKKELSLEAFSPVCA